MIDKIFYIKKKYKKCLDCGYINDFKQDHCFLCKSVNLIEVEEKLKRKWIYYLFSILSIALIFIIFWKIKNKKDKKYYEKEIPVFISEKRMINYHTYLISLKRMKCIKPDKHDIDVIKKAMMEKDPPLSLTAKETFDFWKRKGYLK